MPRRPQAPCTAPGCAAIGPCALHDRKPWAGSQRRHSLPTDWPRRRARILRRDKHRCYLCGALANRVDHITPSSQGGTDNDTNLASICLTCDRTKSAREGQTARRQHA